MKIAIEKLTDVLITEIEPLLAKYYDEHAGWDEEMNVDWDTLLAIPSLTIFVLRNDDKNIVGALIFVIVPYMHIKNLLVAQQITFYVEHEHRKYALKMIRISEEYLTESGVNIITQAARVDTTFGKILERKGYLKQEVFYTKRIN